MSDDRDREDPEGQLAPAIKVKPSGSRLQELYARIEPYEVFVVAAFALAVFLPGMWLYTLIDPWETHYAEVARRILEERDWVHLKWQNEVFRSKPVLTFWLIAASMWLLGVGDGGGYSGEMVSSDLVIFAVRLPFVLFAVLGVTMTWWMLARLVSRRVAWLAALIITTTPFYFMVARQAITDMPMVACSMGAIACFAMAANAGDEPVRPLFRRVNAYHLFAATLVLFVGGQALYYAVEFTRDPALAHGLRLPMPALWLSLTLALGLGGFLFWSWYGQPTPTRRAVLMYWFYFLIGLAILGKGPAGLAVVGAVCYFYTLLTVPRRFFILHLLPLYLLFLIACAVVLPFAAPILVALGKRARLRSAWNHLRGAWSPIFAADFQLLPFRIEFFRGLLIGALVAVPWHVAMWMRDGRPWLNEYFVHHMFKRFGGGVHGDRGTFDYFASQVGIGMWPWVALLPAALALAAFAAHRRSREGQLRLIAGIWAIAGFGVFAISQTKFHHYVLPAIPGLAILIAFWLDDLIAGRLRRVGLAVAAGVAIVLFICRDLMTEQKQLIELFIYRYDRPWPSGPPWHVDLSDPILTFGILFAVLVALVAVWRIRHWAIGALGFAALLFSFWAANDYMQEAAPHWGQRELHRTYYEHRDIHGVEIKYFGLRHLADDWGDSGELRVESVLPADFKVGLPMRVTLHVPGAGVPGDKLVLSGKVSRVGDDAFWIELTESGEAAATLQELISRGKDAPHPSRPPWLQVDADRLIAWQLNWRGENFWSSGEIYGETEDTQTVFMHTDNKEFLAYLNGEGRKDRRYFVITEAGRAAGLKNVLPTKRAKETYEVLDTSCNKFTLLSFTL